MSVYLLEAQSFCILTELFVSYKKLNNIFLFLFKKHTRLYTGQFCFHPAQHALVVRRPDPQVVQDPWLQLVNYQFRFRGIYGLLKLVLVVRVDDELVVARTCK